VASVAAGSRRYVPVVVFPFLPLVSMIPEIVFFGCPVVTDEAGIEKGVRGLSPIPTSAIVVPWPSQQGQDERIRCKQGCRAVPES
jgi:hypothetical protein